MAAAPAHNPRKLVPDFPPDQRVFLLMGTDTARMSDARRELLRRLLSSADRDQLLTEIGPTPNKPLTLAQAAAQVVDELGTPPFFPDQRRVVLLSQPQELFKPGKAKPSKAKKKAPAKPAKSVDADGSGGNAGEARLLAFLERDFPQLRSVLVVEALEDDDKRRKVSEDSPLGAYLMRKAVVLRFNSAPLRFALEEALMRRDGAAAIAAYREWVGADSRFAILGLIADSVRCMTQAAIVDHLTRRPADAARLGNRRPMDLFPNDWRNLPGKFDRQRQRLMEAGQRYGLARLTEALEQLPDLNDSFFPPRDALFVRDLDAAVESFLLRLCA